MSAALRSPLPLAALAVALATACGADATGAPQPSQVPKKLDVRADSIGFFPYSNATLLAAEGHVRLRAGARTIEADSIRLDLKANTLLASGNVRVRGAGDALAVSAYALDLASDRAQCIQLEPVPRAFGLTHDALASAHDGAAPANTFGADDLSHQRPYIRSHHAIVTTNANVRMTPAEFPTSVGASPALPTFVYTFGYNQNLAQQALPSTTLDYPYTLFGNANSLGALHARYTQFDGIELGFDEHLVDNDREFAVVSVLPFRGRRIDLNAYQQIERGPGHVLSQTLSGTLGKTIVAGDYATTLISKEYSARLESAVIEGANAETLTVSTIESPVKHLLFGYKAAVGYGYEHNPGQSPFTGDFRIAADARVDSPTVRLPYGTSATASYEWSAARYDIPRLYTSGTTTLDLATRQLALTRRRSRTIQFDATVQFQQVDDRYRNDAAAYLRLPDPTFPYLAPDGTPYPGYFAYAGRSTYRTYSLRTTLASTSENSATLVLTKSRDFPQDHGFGRAPLYATAYLTLRLSSTLRIDVSRSYSFGWNHQYFTPQTSFSVSP